MGEKGTESHSECSICGVVVDEDDRFEGYLGLIPFVFCPFCRAGIYHWACDEWFEEEVSMFNAIAGAIARFFDRLFPEQEEYLELEAVDYDDEGDIDDLIKSEIASTYNNNAEAKEERKRAANAAPFVKD